MFLKFEKAQWIWGQKPAEKDEHVEFFDSFSYDGKGSVSVRLSADSNYTLWVNGTLAGFGQYADYPSYKVGDSIDVTEHLVRGENTLAVSVWYYGEDSQTYRCGNAGLIYEVQGKSGVLAFSSPDTRSRISPTDLSGECRRITVQLGYTYHRDDRKKDGYPAVCGEGFAPSAAVEGITAEIHARPIKRLMLGERISGQIVQQGTFAYNTRTESLGRDMETAALSYLPLFEMSGSYDRGMREGLALSAEGGEGIYFIVDLGREEVGFLDLDIEVAQDCRIDIGYGEHLAEGRCRTGVRTRNFSAAYEAKAGRNAYLHTFRRFGCRYLQFFVHASHAVLHYAGLRPTSYPLTYKRFAGGNLLRDTVYAVAQRTLDCCMHEHYEDCPWREQALYTMDSRNQMLCGYYAFGEKEFPRASLRLIAEGLGEDGFLDLCYPAAPTIAIPSFSLVYFLQMWEYIQYSGDTTLAAECFPVLERLHSGFAAQKTKDGVLQTVVGDARRYWNFYEWSPKLDGHGKKGEACAEAPISAFYVMALESMAKICQALGKQEAAESYLAEAAEVRGAIGKVFFDASVGLFKTRIEETTDCYDVLTQALCLLCGAAEGLDTETILSVLAANGAADTGLTVHSDTLSMSGFRYDALIKTDRERYRETILSEIDRTYFEMLRGGATTFWETILGEADFHEAGSLCHGWSAMPIYYYETLL